ncbi:MAG: hypothetical protein DSZ05_04110 [Sulfurospirillum sp.]|nr:MAG: hypothetical protein DSZ05_04110 [Sulfurospirillum sp.]
MRLIVLFLSLCTLLFAKLIPIDIQPADYNTSRYPKVEILDSKIVSFGRIGGEKFFGISALAYDPETGILYMLSDRSRLFGFKLRLKGEKIASLKPLFGTRLRDAYGHKYFVKKSDSEGMTLVKADGRKLLLISFERYPRVTAFGLSGNARKAPVRKTLSDIRASLRLTHLPKVLQNPRHYKKRNDMLESVTYTQKYGMITTPEKPLRKRKHDLHGIYNQEGKICDIRNNGTYAITELETLPDGNLLALERDFRLKPALNILVRLRKIELDKKYHGICKTKTLFEATSEEGWALDNFEGVTHLHDDLYLMVSDDNDNFFQKTLLVLFRLSN